VNNVFTELMAVSVIYLHTKFLLSVSSGLLFIVIEPKAECSIRTAAMLMFYIPQKETLIKISCFFFPKIYNNTKFHYQSFALTSEVCTASMLTLFMLGN
jgi:alpha-N-acetylglucosamine transferase